MVLSVIWIYICNNKKRNDNTFFPTQHLKSYTSHLKFKFPLIKDRPLLFHTFSAPRKGTQESFESAPIVRSTIIAFGYWILIHSVSLFFVDTFMTVLVMAAWKENDVLATILAFLTAEAVVLMIKQTTQK